MPCLPVLPVVSWLPAGPGPSCMPAASSPPCCVRQQSSHTAAACLLQAAAPPPRVPEPHAKAEDQAPLPTPEMLTPADLQRKVTIRLEETETVWLLQLTGGCVNQETPEGKVVSAANTRCVCTATPRSELGDSAGLPWLLPMPLSAGVMQPLLCEPGGGG